MVRRWVLPALLSCFLSSVVSMVLPPPSSAPPEHSLSSVLETLTRIGLGVNEDETGVGGGSKTTARHRALREEGRAASVLVLVSSDQHVLFTLRSKRLKSHPGQVSFPGGRQDPEDGGDDVVTALRETWEEVGLDYRGVWTTGESSPKRPRPENPPEGLRIACRMPTTEAMGRLCVTPIVAVHTQKSWRDLHAELVLNEDEVEAAFWVPLAWFAGGDNLGDLYEVPDWPVEGETFVYRSYRYHDFPLAEKDQFFDITGLTAHMVHEVAHRVCGSGTGASPARNDSGAKEGGVESDNKNQLLRGVLKRKLPGRSSSRWMSGCFVLLSNGGSRGGGMLHQYDSVQDALRKQHSANKKNRLRLVPNTPSDDSLTRVEALDATETNPNNDDEETDAPGGYGFGISTLNGRIRWELSASSAEERDRWMERIRSIASPGDGSTSSK